MNGTRWILGLIATSTLTMSVAAVDLSKIDRRIAKEPVYQSKSPTYCLLVIGPAAKKRIWLVIDDITLHVDRNGNGDLAEQDERVPLSLMPKERAINL